jgi:signal transduction histidine kinase
VITTSLVDNDNLISSIVAVEVILLFMLLAGLAVINRKLSKNIWQPFYNTLRKLQNYTVENTEPLALEPSGIDEFNDLQKSLEELTQRTKHAYLGQKEFAENASHEMQTPLAVAQTKLELLLQDPGIHASQMEAISQAATSLQRLSKLNQSLLVLAKIENQQYEPATAIDLTDVTKKYLHLFSEIITDKQIVVDTEFTGSFEVKLHPFLADSLISNLLGNAIKYNHTGGKIKVAVNSMQYFIENTSHEPAIDARQLFKRFGNSNNNGRSTGLGLAIVKKIAETHQLSISYRHISSMHQFILSIRTGNVLSVDASNSWSSG